MRGERGGREATPIRHVMPKLGICIAAHGAPPTDYPPERFREFMALSAQHHAGSDGEGIHELDAQMRAWPRTADNDPYAAGVAKVASKVRVRGYDLVEIGYNEFCAPTVDAAIDRLVTAGAARVVVVSTMLISGGSHAEIDIAASVTRARRAHPSTVIVYAWPYDPDAVAGLYVAQAESFHEQQRPSVLESGHPDLARAPVRW